SALSSAAPRRSLWSRGSKIAALGVILALAACERNQSGQAGGPPGGGAGGPAPKAQLNVVTLHPRSIAVTAELPGRTAAALVAEVRP
ncbi:hypothetical protein J8J27_30425, partial [Mycobacterium tuberculosis]|nr:hypothetical protein [Mycobacterium tuberculosis]